MAEANDRSTEDVRRDIATERDQLAGAVEDLRTGIGEAANLRGKLPLIAASALGAGFVLAGGVGATMRFVARRGRDGRERVKLGRFSLVDKSSVESLNRPEVGSERGGRKPAPRCFPLALLRRRGRPTCERARPSSSP